MPPRPTPTPLSAPFWETLRDHGRLTVPECAGCGRRFFVPEPTCPHCGAGRWSWTNSDGIGSVYSCVTVHQTVSRDQPTPFVLAIVELDEEWSILTHVIDCAPDDVVIGARVRFAPRQIDDDLTLPTFALATTAENGIPNG